MRGVRHCDCEICKVYRGIGELQEKYKISEEDMGPIKRLSEMAEADSTDLGMLRLKLKELSEQK
jgi:hypothetical protein